MIDLIIKIIGAVMPLLLGALGYYFKWKMDKTKRDYEEAMRIRDEEQDRKLEIKFNKMIERQQELESGFFDLRRLVENHFNETDNKDFVIDGLKKATDDEALRLIKSNFIIGTSKKSMLTKWGKLMHDLASSFHADGSRKEDEIKRREILTEKENLIISEFNSFVNEKSGEIRVFNRTECRFSDFMEKNNMYGTFRVLISDLVENNLTDEKYVKKFLVQTNSFCRALIIAQSEWCELELAYRKSEKVA